MKALSNMSYDDLLTEYEKRFKSRHYQKEGVEVYDFNIKIYLVDIPDIVSELLTQDEIDEKYQEAAQRALQDLAEQLKGDYDWISNWYQEGRSGGWLTLVAHDEVFLEENPIRVPRKRIRDLREIDKKVRTAARDFVNMVESPDFWEIDPRDWSPRVEKK